MRANALLGTGVVLSVLAVAWPVTALRALGTCLLKLGTSAVFSWTLVDPPVTVFKCLPVSIPKVE